MKTTEKEQQRRSGDRLRVIRATVMNHPSDGLTEFAAEIGAAGPTAVRNAEAGANWTGRMPAGQIQVKWGIPMSWLYFGLNEGDIPRPRYKAMREWAERLKREGFIEHDPFTD